MIGIIGKKLGMTQIYDDKDELIPVTVVQAGPCPVVQVKSSETDGYAALQLAFEEIPPRKANKPRSGHFGKAELKPHRLLKEFRGFSDEHQVGEVVDVTSFESGDVVKVTGKSKGKGFAGVVKKYHFSGKNSSHGTPDRVRHAGSIGQGTTPGKVWKGKRMPGHMGNVKLTVRGLRVVRVDAERHLLFIKGAVPGGVNGYLTIAKA